MFSKTLVFFGAVLVCVNAQVPYYDERYPITDELPRVARHPRDTRDFVAWDRPLGGGNLFGTLGQSDQGLFGRAGYNREIFNDDRGVLSGQAYGSRVLGPFGDTSSYGGQLNWKDDNAKAVLDVHRNIGGPAGASLSGSGVWDLGKNTHLSAGGHVSKEFGHSKPDVGVQAEITHEWGSP